MSSARTMPPPPLSAAPRLSADLAKLRDRFLADHPEHAARADLLAHVPTALRHVLSLQLELARADALPRRYRALAEATVSATATEPASLDAVDRLVVVYASAVRAGDHRAAACRLQLLRRYFTESQLVELALVLALARAFTEFDTILGIGEG